MMKGCISPIKTIEYQWIIEGFSKRLECVKQKGKERLLFRSCAFPVDDENGIKSYLFMYLNGPEHEDKDLFGLYANFEDWIRVKSIWARPHFSLVDSTQQEVLNRCASFHLFDTSEGGWGFRKFIETTKLLENTSLYLPDDKLTVICRLTVIGDSIPMIIPNPPKPISEAEDGPSDFAKFFKNEKQSDVILILKDKRKIPAHKIILMARSSFFMKIFEDATEEKISNEVNIEDTDPDVFEIILRYIYTDVIPDLDDNVPDLIAAADKYGLEELTKACLEHLHDNITDSNAMQIFTFAERYHNQELLEKTRQFINDRIKGNNDEKSTTTKST